MEGAMRVGSIPTYSRTIKVELFVVDNRRSVPPSSCLVGGITATDYQLDEELVERNKK